MGSFCTMNAPLLVVVIMVKNEEEAMVNTLLPFTSQGVKHMCVFDTGSTDKTIEVTKAFFNEHNIEGYIDQEPFVDFSTSRNRGLELAEQHFPNATFFIIPDADWYIQNVPRLLAFCEAEKFKSLPLYNIRVNLENIQYFSARLFRVSARNRYVGAVHEVPEISSITEQIYNDVYFEHTLTTINRQKSASRYQRDLQLLLKSIEKNPTDPRSLFYLAQTYECLKDYKTAYHYYLNRSRVNGWVEENVVTFYRLGYLAEYLSKTDAAFSWSIALDHYLKSFALRPTRLEALVKIAEYYQRDNPQIAAIYMKHAYYVPYPKDDSLFVIKDVYEYKRYELLSICAWYIGEHELGKQATEIALRISPNCEALKRNLQIYQDTIAAQAKRIFVMNPSAFSQKNANFL